MARTQLCLGVGGRFSLLLLLQLGFQLHHLCPGGELEGQPSPKPSSDLGSCQTRVKLKQQQRPSPQLEETLNNTSLVGPFVPVITHSHRWEPDTGHLAQTRADRAQPIDVKNSCSLGNAGERTGPFPCFLLLRGHCKRRFENPFCPARRFCGAVLPGGNRWYELSPFFARVLRTFLLLFEHWRRLPGEAVESPFVEMLRSCVGTVLGTRLEQGVGPGDPSDAPQPGVFVVTTGAAASGAVYRGDRV